MSWVCKLNDFAASQAVMQRVKCGEIPIGTRSVSEDRYSLLMYAAQQGVLEDVRYLLEAGEELEAVDCRGLTPLFFGLANAPHNPEVVPFLLDCGADVNMRSNGGITPLHRAASRPRHALTYVELLLERGADPNAVISHSGRAVLHEAAAGASGGPVFRLLQAGADSTFAEADGSTALANLLRTWDFDCPEVVWLLACGAELFTEEGPLF